MKVIRVLVYETMTPEEMSKQLGQSMPDGKKEFGYGKSITAITVRPEDTAKLGDEVDLLRAEVIKAMDWETREVD